VTSPLDSSYWDGQKVWKCISKDSLIFDMSLSQCLCSVWLDIGLGMLPIVLGLLCTSVNC